jgi:hypothetical protein|tara:strand:- start:10902 stop:11120 length:219 start_codon:yes stop_codon:yes gene_type:complete
MKYINFPYFLCALAIGLFLNYIHNPEQKVIYVYPTPDNSKKVLYKDYADNCYKYKATVVKCNDNAKAIPAQV